ncbi:MAG TPA: hypothetical protein VK807_15005 [Gemmatimonadaceae bacterium]|nr:hypothetical protein [Gemmatimonadaceae bacterium]
MPRALWLAMLLCLGCAGSRLTTAPTPAEIDAMLLPPVDGQLALWVNQPTNFAVIGATQAHGADVLYQQTALQGVPLSGYVYVPQGDAGYDRVYLVASHDPINLTGSLDDAIAGANVVDAYAADTVGLDSLRCNDGRLSLVRRTIVIKHPERTRVDEERFAECYLQHHFERHRYALAAGRQFFAMQPGKPAPTTKKFLPPGYKPPKLVPKPGTRLDRSDQRALRWYAAKDQWHAITHNGEPGTELPRALGYVRYGSVWVPNWGNAMLGGAHEEVRAIVNGNVGSVHGTGYTSSYHEAATRASYSAPSYSAPTSSASSHGSSSTSSAGSSSSGTHH